MLVLTRKPNQQLHIGNDIVITVVKVRGNTIRLGIEAPRDVRVIRSELEGKPETGSQKATVIIAEIAKTTQCDAQGDNVQVSDNSIEAAPVRLSATTDSQSSAGARASKRSPLKSFTSAKQSQAPHGVRNLEDNPLCHEAPKGERTVIQSPRSTQSRLGRGPLSHRAPLSQRSSQIKTSTGSFALVSHS